MTTTTTNNKTKKKSYLSRFRRLWKLFKGAFFVCRCWWWNIFFSIPQCSSLTYDVFIKSYSSSTSSSSCRSCCQTKCISYFMLSYVAVFLLLLNDGLWCFMFSTLQHPMDWLILINLFVTMTFNNKYNKHNNKKLKTPKDKR